VGNRQTRINDVGVNAIITFYIIVYFTAWEMKCLLEDYGSLHKSGLLIDFLKKTFVKINLPIDILK